MDYRYGSHTVYQIEYHFIGFFCTKVHKGPQQFRLVFE